MYLVCKYAPFKRVLQPQPAPSSASTQHHYQQQQQQPKDSRRHDAAAVKELQHLNHKIVSCLFSLFRFFKVYLCRLFFVFFFVFFLFLAFVFSLDSCGWLFHQMMKQCVCVVCQKIANVNYSCMPIQFESHTACLLLG